MWMRNFLRIGLRSALSGLAVGAYHFFSFDSSGKDQLAHFIQCLPDREGMLPPAVDVEFYGDKAANPPNPADVGRSLGPCWKDWKHSMG